MAAGANSWNPSAAAKYLDDRELWWQSWSKAQRDHGTSCVSCHTVMPYSLARPALQKFLGEGESPVVQKVMFERLEKRVSLWSDVEPFYTDAKSGPNKSIESRATESVLNAFMLAAFDAQAGHLREITRKAFANAWEQQLKSGPRAGAWEWQQFHLSPWESEESQYQGATFMALAIGFAPDHYEKTKSIQSNVELLRRYLVNEYSQQPLLNRLVVLWASSRMKGLLATEERGTLVDSILSKQKQDGGWSLSSLGDWKRRDGTEEDTSSDGYATALAVLALRNSGSKSEKAAVQRGIEWLTTHQESLGNWYTASLNKKRDPNTDVGRFMSDAATGYAVLALTTQR